MAKIPTPQEHASLWSKLDVTDRRRILKAVRRGEALTNRREARVAIGVARQQQRYWRWIWLLGPAVGLALIPQWTAVALNAVLGALLMGFLSVHRIRKARACEAANLERLGVRPATPK